jgi:hypothetical protein
LLLADVEGSTRLWETASEEMAAAFANLDRTLADLAPVHHGVRPVEQGEGDSFVVAFTRASDAVACALALQLAPIRLRIGGAYRGSAAARRRQLHRPGHQPHRPAANWHTAVKPCYPAPPATWWRTCLPMGHG